MDDKEEKKVDEWRVLNKLVAEWDEVESNDVPTVECGDATFNFEIKLHRKKKKKSEDEEVKG